MYSLVGRIMFTTFAVVFQYVKIFFLLHTRKRDMV